MFRKGGGTNMNGIMSGITNREMHANSDEQGVGGPTFKEQVQNRMDIIQSAVGGNKGLDDPLTQFLLSYGPAIATQKPTGNLLGTIVGAAKGPTENLFKNIREQKKLRTGVALEVLENLNDEDIAPFIQKAKQIAKETGRDYKTVLNQLVETEL